jgi:GT2 family glycosyltransferase
MFARREAYSRAGGFTPMALFEDVDLVRRLRRVGRLAFPSVRAFTSPRRWEERGILRTMLCNWWVFWLYSAGANPSRLERIYGSGRTG